MNNDSNVLVHTEKFTADVLIFTVLTPVKGKVSNHYKFVYGAIIPK